MEANKQGQRAAAAVATAERVQYLTFVLGEETFGMPIRFIREVIPFGHLTEVPLVPEFVRGLINLRGSVVPVLDLSVRFGRNRTELSPRTCVVVLEVPCQDQSVMLGCIVDQVREVLEIDPESIEPVPAFGSDLQGEFLAGIAKLAGCFVILLDVAQVLSIEDLARLATAGAGAAT
jgi:purine-binding chemotaxis protein CheW